MLAPGSVAPGVPDGAVVPAPPPHAATTRIVLIAASAIDALGMVPPSGSAAKGRGGAGFMTPPGSIAFHDGRMTEPDALDIVPLTGDRFADLAGLFEQGGDPRWCWCMYFRIRGRTWSNSSAAVNREDLRQLTETADAGEREAPGLVAYRDGAAVGWVSLGPRPDYDRLAWSTLLGPVDDRPVWSIVCFVVGRRHRRQGVAARLLDAAIEHARSRGVRTLEAYPLHESRGRVSGAAAYVGTQAMFERAGFRVVEVRRWNETAPPRPIMRLELRARPRTAKRR
jgi:GNAT superfamily N-acetyltransferase